MLGFIRRFTLNASGHRRVPASFYADYRITIPKLAIQQQLITEIATIDAADSKKQAILKQYL